MLPGHQANMELHEAKHDLPGDCLSALRRKAKSKTSDIYANEIQDIPEQRELDGKTEVGTGLPDTEAEPSDRRPAPIIIMPKAKHEKSTPVSSDSFLEEICSTNDLNCAPELQESISTLKNVSFFSYMYVELTRGYLLEHDEAKFTEKRLRVYEFMKIPREVEKFMTYGFMQCVDAFLYVFTFLPLRFLMALVKLVVKGCFSSCWSTPGRVLEPAQICDLLKGFILVVCCIIMNYVDVSMMYHIIRGQAIIKLYIFFNMLEVADRLFSSFGQDILDSLFWTATEPRGRKREHIGLVPHLALAIIYVFLHAILVLFQATTLNVAFNSHNKALLTIMMSNNFVELKGSVFKKFEKNNLFQMSCSDVRERFHFLVLLAIVSIRNLTEFSWSTEHLLVLVPDVLMVMGSEFLVDWVKHAFITKFNEIPHEVYREYRISIAYDMATSRHNNAFSDHLDTVSRRMGFIPLPLAVILVRVVFHSVKISDRTGYLLLALFYLCLLSFKVLNSIIILGKACDYIQETHKKAQHSSEPCASKKEYSRSGSMPHHAKSQCTKDSTPGNSLPRRHSFGSKLNTVASLPDYEPTLAGRPSLTPKMLFSNSTVSLVELNEDYVKETKSEEQTGIVAPPTSTHLVQRGPSKKPQKSLSEIDRYDMCSNRII